MDAIGCKRKYSEASASVRLRPSRLAALLVALGALATLGVLAATPGASPVRILAGTWIVCAAVEAIHSRALLRGRRAVRAVEVRSGLVEVEDGRGRRRAGRLRPGSFVAPWLTIVRWRPDGARFDRTVPILPGMAPGEALRRMRVVLRWG